MNLLKKLFIAAIAVTFYSSLCTQACARVNFLPGNGGARTKNVGRAASGDSCSGYNLRQKKCDGLACSSGWNCQSCTNAQGQHWKCTPNKCTDGYTSGKTSCGDCSQYSYNGFAGNQICGKCTAIDNCTSTPNEDSFTYLNKVRVNGTNVEETKKTGYRLQ